MSEFESWGKWLMCYHIRFAQSKDDMELTKADLDRVDAIEKAAEKRKKSSEGTSFKRRFLDKSRDTCKKCGQIGHWANDPECLKREK